MPDDHENARVFMDGLKPGDVALLRDVAELAAENAVRNAFTKMGLDPEQPIKAQRDFNFLRDLVHNEEFGADMDWLRRARQRSEGMSGKVWVTLVGLSVVGAWHALWAGIVALAAKAKS